MNDNNPLRVISTDTQISLVKQLTKPKTSREETRARFERLWLLNPNQFDPLRNCLERERLQRTLNLLKKHVSLEGKKIVDLGCGTGYLAKKFYQAGACVDAVDVASRPLKEMQEKESCGIKLMQDSLPSTLLDDEAYDIVVCTEVIGYLAERDYRLLFNELSRLVNKQGYVVCSTAIDVYSEDALQKFISLAQTELEIVDWTFSYHSLLITLRNFLEAPQTFIKANQNSQFKQTRLAERSSLGKWWLKMNSSSILTPFWKIISLGSNFLVNCIKQTYFFMILLEKLSLLFFGDAAISHVIFISQRRPLISDKATEPFSVDERKPKRTVWE